MVLNEVIEQSETYIHPQAVIDPSAKIGNNVTIGPWTIIGANTVIGDGTTIASHVNIGCNTKIGSNNKIYSFAAVGGDPQDANFNDEDTFLELGDNNYIREYVTLNRGSARGTRITKIGSNNMFLASSHVGHDCIIGNHVTFVNGATTGGHVQVDDHAIIGAFSAVHQFCRVGAYSFATHSAMVVKDVLPYIIVKGEPCTPAGLNSIGLKRKGFSSKTIMAIKRAYHVIFLKGLKLEHIKQELAIMAQDTPEIQHMLDMIEGAKRSFTQ